MLQDRESKLKLYSLGIVIITKPRGTDYIEVSPIEDLPLVDGLIEDLKYKYDVTLPDAKGKAVSSKVEGNNILKAKWIPFGHSNRMSAPDVVKNETVVIFRFADTDEYYWTTIFREPSIRRLETVLYAYGDLPIGLTPFDKDSSYWAEVSTHDKYIQVHTSKSDGEPYEYDIIIETAKGSVTVKDDVGNYYKLDSPSGTITANANEHIVLNAPLITLNANNIVNNASSSIHNNTPVTYDSDDVVIGGNLYVQGSEYIDGGLSVGGGGSSRGSEPPTMHNGNLQVKGSANFEGNISVGYEADTEKDSTTNIIYNTPGNNPPPTGTVYEKGNIKIKGSEYIEGDINLDGALIN